MVAEKAKAVVSLGVANSRMKDFYDLWMIGRTFRFGRTVLTAALRRTFERRRTGWPTDVPPGLPEFAADKGGQWRAFLGRERLGAAPDAVETALGDLRAFLLPLFAGAEVGATWSPGGPWTDEEARS